MAVYTDITKNELDSFLALYNIEKIIKFTGIKEGVENSNFLLESSNAKYILTIFEKRTDENDLPFFFNLMNHLNDNEIKCPQVIKDKSKKLYNLIKDKPAVITSFLNGISLKKIEPKHCGELGENLAKFHLASNKLKIKRDNALGIKDLTNLMDSINKLNLKEHADLLTIINNEYDYLKNKLPFDLPSGIIHADLFPDNVFFINEQLSGIIDFYFACNDYYAYELAICINAWCFERDNEFNISKAKSFLHQYNSIRKISAEELESLPTLARAAALRFLLTRLYDKIHHDENNLVSTKDPQEYYEKLKFHQTVKSVSEYGL
ncbi:homoserine kinase [Pelagibacteraceae bacterium]|nr:homoserine kinase [Pelagibacteraceae bacterium]